VSPRLCHGIACVGNLLPSPVSPDLRAQWPRSGCGRGPGLSMGIEAMRPTGFSGFGQQTLKAFTYPCTIFVRARSDYNR